MSKTFCGLTAVRMVVDAGMPAKTSDLTLAENAIAIGTPSPSFPPCSSVLIILKRMSLKVGPRNGERGHMKPI